MWLLVSLIFIFALMLPIVRHKSVRLINSCDSKSDNVGKFQYAIDLLSKSNEYAVIHGANLLYNIAKDEEQSRKPIFDILWVYLKENSKEDVQSITISEQTILNILFKAGEDGIFIFRPHKADLSGINLRHADLRGAYLLNVNFTDSDLSYSDISGANLSDSLYKQAKSLKGIICENTGC